MSELELLDARIQDAIGQGDWVLVGSTAFLILLGVVLGLISWLKGRKAIAVLTWLLLGACAALMLLPLSTVQRVVNVTTSTLSWSLVGMAAASLVIGFISAVRLARPPSWWAQRRYDNDRYAEAIERHQWTRPQAR